MINCPDTRLPAWKALADALGGEEQAYVAWFRNGSKLPEVDAARGLIGVVAEPEISATVEAMKKPASVQTSADYGQKRAKPGGEYGPNGEWYEGGKFIATREETIKSSPIKHEVSPEEQSRRDKLKAESERAAAQYEAWKTSRRSQLKPILQALNPVVLDQWGNPIPGQVPNQFYKSLHDQLYDSGTLSEKQANFVAKLIYGRLSNKTADAWEKTVGDLTEDWEYSPTTPATAQPSADLFAPAEMPFNLTGEKETRPVEKPSESTTGYGTETLAQQEMFAIEKIVEGKDPAKSADAAQQMYGSAQAAAVKIRHQLDVLDTFESKTGKVTKRKYEGFSDEQRDRLRNVLALLEQRAQTRESVPEDERKFSKELEDEIEFKLDTFNEGRDEGEPAMTRGNALLELMQDMDDKDRIASEFKKELQDYGIERGIFKPMTRTQLDATAYMGRGKKYDFKRGDTYYVFERWPESWQPRSLPEEPQTNISPLRESSGQRGGVTPDIIRTVLKDRFGSENPERVTIIKGDPNLAWAAQIHDRNWIEVNPARIVDAADAHKVLLEEGMHGIWKDKRFRKAVKAFVDKVVPEDVRAEQQKRIRAGSSITDEEAMLEEAAIARALKEPEAPPVKSALAQFFDDIVEALRRVFGMKVRLSDRDTLLNGAMNFVRGERPVEQAMGTREAIGQPMGWGRSASFLKAFYRENEAQQFKDDQEKTNPDRRLIIVPAGARFEVHELPSPKPLAGDRMVTIERPDGSTYQAAYGGKVWEGAGPNGEDVPSIAKLVNGQWSHGMLEPGERIVETRQSVPEDERDRITGTPEFKKWFGKSKVVDADGKPLVVYRYQKSDTQEFHPFTHFGTRNQAEGLFRARQSRGEGVEGGNTTAGYLSIQNPLRVTDDGGLNVESIAEQTEPELAMKMRQEIFDKHSEIFAKLQKKNDAEVAVWTKKKLWKSGTPRPKIKEWETTNATREFQHNRDTIIPAKYGQLLTAKLEARGHDGLIYKNERESNEENRTDHNAPIAEQYKVDSYIIFHPTQIKSVFNRGTWSGTSDNIRQSIPPEKEDDGLPPKDKPTGDPQSYIVQIASQKYTVPSKFTVSDVDRAVGAKAVQDLFTQLKLPGQIDTRVDPRPANVRGNTDINMVFQIDPTQAFEPGAYDAEGRRLIEVLRDQIQKLHTDQGNLPYLSQLSNAIAKNFNRGNLNGVFTRPVIKELMELVAGDRSFAGTVLHEYTGLPDSELDKRARNADFYLKHEFAKAYDPNGATSQLLQKVIWAFKDFFTDTEIQDALKGHPELEQELNALLIVKAREQGGRLYRRIQNTLKPKKPLTVAEKEANAMIEEAAKQTLELYEKSGGEISKPLKDQKLTARETLRLVTTEKTEAKIQVALERALFEAQRNAAIDALGDLIHRDAARADEYRERLSALVEDQDAVPEAADVARGMQMPKHAHWLKVEDILGYSPTSVKLLENVIRQDFRGARFTTPEAKPPDVRIDLAKLAEKPDDEIRRVFDEYLAGVEATMPGATPATIRRVKAMIQQRLSEQVAQLRGKVLDKAFEPPKEAAAKPEMQAAVDQYKRLTRLFNAGLLKDDRAADTLIDNVAAKAVVQRFTPSFTELIKQTFATPIAKQGELGKVFAERLSHTWDLSPEEKANAQRLFEAAFNRKFATAREKALKKAQEGLTPHERREFGERTTLWRKITDFIHSGGLDDADFFQRMAGEHGWNTPAPAQLAELRALSDREEQLREPKPAEMEGKTPEQQDEVRRRVEAATLEERQQLKHKMQVMWSKFSRPINWRKHWQDPMFTANNTQAMNEMLAGNLLAKIGFPFRQAFDVVTQGMIHVPTRAIAEGFERWDMARKSGDLQNIGLMRELSNVMQEALDGAVQGIRPGLDAFARTFVGRGEHRNVEQLVSAISAFDRVRDKAKEYEAQGKPGMAFASRLIALLEYGRRFAAAADYIHGTPTEWQEISLEIGRELRARGLSYGEIGVMREQIMGNIKARALEVKAQARKILEDRGIEASPGAIRHAAWNIVKADTYARMQNHGLPADEFRTRNDLLRNIVGWNIPEAGGPGAWLFGAPFKKVQAGLAAIGLPAPPVQFANAMAISLNRALSLTPLGSFPSVFKGSRWYDAEWQSQRKVESVLGTSFGVLLGSAVISGLIKVNNQLPTDPKERQAAIAAGMKANTIWIPVGNGEHLQFSLTVGPFRYVAPFLSAAGAWKDALDVRAKKQARLDAEGAKQGLPPGQVQPLDGWDMMGVLAHGMWSTISGGRTASGLVQSYVNPWDLSAKQPVAALVSPLIPALPAYQEITRMMGTSIDPHRASFLDMLVPIPGSGAQRLNIMGDPMRDEDDVRRIIQILTGGSYPIPTADVGNDTVAYGNFFNTSYRPTATDPNKGYQFGNEYRPMTPWEMGSYLKARGEAFKANLAALGDIQGLPEDQRAKLVRQAFQQADVQGQQAVGATPRAGAQAATAPAGHRGRPAGSITGVPRGFVFPSAGATVGMGGGRGVGRSIRRGRPTMRTLGRSFAPLGRHIRGRGLGRFRTSTRRRRLVRRMA